MCYILLVVLLVLNDVKVWVDIVVQQNLCLLVSNYVVNVVEEIFCQCKVGYLLIFDVVVQYQKGDNDVFGFVNSVVNLLVYYGKYVEECMIGLELNILIYSGGLIFFQVCEFYQCFNQSE